MPYIQVAIVGMGILGRKLFRELIDVDTGNFRLNWNILCIADTNAPSEIAYLLNHDTVYGNIKNVATSDMPIRGNDANNKLDFAGRLIPVYADTDYNKLPLGELGVDTVIDCTGTTTVDKAQDYLNAGAHRVVIMSELAAGNAVPTIAYAVNKAAPVTNGDKIICIPAGQCIASAIVAKAIYDSNLHYFVGNDIIVGSYTGLNNLQDSYRTSDVESQMKRAGAWNLIKSNRKYSRAIGYMVPALNGKVDSTEIRSATIRGAMTYCNYIISGWDKKTFDAVFKSIADDETVIVDEEAGNSLVSSDVVGTPFVWYCNNASEIYDSNLGGSLVTIPVLYDPIAIQVSNAIYEIEYLAEQGI